MTPIDVPAGTEIREKTAAAKMSYRWFYAFFAGLVACPIALLLSAVRLSRLGELSWQALSWPAFLILSATVCARLAAGRAMRCGDASHGPTAAIFTWLFYSGALALLAPLAAIGSVVWQHYDWGTAVNGEFLFAAVIMAPLYIFIFSSFIVMPACAAGTALFNVLLHAAAALRRWFAQPKPEA